jgi:hypothetical protein
MNMFVKFILLVLIYSSSLWAQKNRSIDASWEAKILEMSASKQSFLLDLGSLDGIKVGDYAIIYTVEGDFEHPHPVKKGLIEAIKSMGKISYWIVRSKEANYNLNRNTQVKIAKSDEILRGLRPLKYKKQLLFHDKRDLPQNFTQEVPESLIKKEEDHKIQQVIVETKWQHDEDGRILKYVDTKNTEKRKYDENLLSEIESIYLETPKDFITGKTVKEYKKDVFENYMEQSFAHYNRYNGIEELHYVAPSGFKDRKESLINRGAVAKMKSEGALWSRDMNDDELRHYMVDSGIAQEEERRHKALHKKTGNEFLARLLFGAEDNTTTVDEQLHGTSFGGMLGYEFHLMRTTPDAESFTFEFNIGQDTNFYDFGGVNVKSKENYYKVGANYYLYNSPADLQKYLWYIGLGIKKGSSLITSATQEGRTPFSFTSFPSYQLGLKYRFKAGDVPEEVMKVGMGINLAMIYEKLKLSAINDVSETISGTKSFTDLKFLIGVSLFL